MRKRFKNLDRLILTDCDGVCLDWEYAFNIWMQEHGFTEVEGSKLSYDMSIRYNIPKEQVRKLIKIFTIFGESPGVNDNTDVKIIF
jgi:hypothetical protein